MCVLFERAFFVYCTDTSLSPPFTMSNLTKKDDLAVSFSGISDEDMKDILAPSCSTDDDDDLSVLRQVEAEIANARNHSTQKNNKNDDDDDDDDKEDNDDESFDRVLLRGVMSSSEATEEIYFENEDWQEDDEEERVSIKEDIADDEETKQEQGHEVPVDGNPVSNKVNEAKIKDPVIDHSNLPSAGKDRIEFRREYVSSSSSDEEEEAPLHHHDSYVTAYSVEHNAEQPLQEIKTINTETTETENELQVETQQEIKESTTNENLSPSKSETLVDPTLQARLREKLINRSNNDKMPWHEKPIASRKIRFRHPFPVIKPPKDPRSKKDIIQSHQISEEQPLPSQRNIVPKDDLKKLLASMKDESTVRRSHSCGAIKILMTNKKNQKNLVRTIGFLEAICFAAKYQVPYLGERDQAIEARLRAVSCLKMAAEQKVNRRFLIGYSGFLNTLSQVMEEEAGMCRLVACETVVLLAKTPFCKTALSESNRLLETLSQVLSSRVRTPICSYIDGDPHSGAILTGASTNSMNNSNKQDSDDSPELSKNPSSFEEGVEIRLESIASHEFLGKQERCGIRQTSQAAACAILYHLSKECATVHRLVLNSKLLSSLADIASDHSTAIHSKALEVFSNIAKFPYNNTFLAKHENVLMTLLDATSFPESSDRILALRTLQNISTDKASKKYLAKEEILTCLASRCMTEFGEEKEIAVTILQNIVTEPATVVPVTNTKNLIATLIHLAHERSSSTKVRILASEALATISLWIQTVGGSGAVPKDVPNLPLPTGSGSGWMMWEE